jgi:hypothetical protein
MEILRQTINIPGVKNIKSRFYGTIEELMQDNSIIEKAYVLKTAEGASSSGVYLAKSKKELIRKAKKISRTKYLLYEVWDYARTFKHKGYIKESRHRKKFIVQDFIDNLQNDWKIYIFGKKYFIFYRPILNKKDFRASGGGYENYFYGKDANIPEGIFDYAQIFYNQLQVPHLSLDIAYDGKNFFILEFQALYFGTAGILFSDHYFECIDGSWKAKSNDHDIERHYVDSIISFLNIHHNENIIHK